MYRRALLAFERLSIPVSLRIYSLVSMAALIQPRFVSNEYRAYSKMTEYYVVGQLRCQSHDPSNLERMDPRREGA